MRAANSAVRSPANTRWAWLSTKPGMHRAAARVDRRSGEALRRPGTGPGPRHAAALHQQRRIGQQPEPARLDEGVVGDQRRRCCRAGSRSSSRPRSTRPGPQATSSTSRWRPPETTRRPATTTSRTSPAVAAKHGSPRAAARHRRGVPSRSRTVTRSAAAPRRDAARPRASRARRGRRRSPPRAGRPRASGHGAAERSRSSSSTARASSSRSITALLSLPSAERRPGGRRARGPGRCRRRGRARWWGTCRRSCGSRPAARCRRR